MKLTLPRSGKSPQNKKSGRKAHAPRFNKPVDETWWVLMGEIESGELTTSAVADLENALSLSESQ